jgi:tryptophan synthase alpha chain
MSNIKKAFENGKAFIPFITCGDPDLGTTAKIVRAMEKNGADLIELGIPFSDPTAEGPVIQEANIRALAAGTTTDKVFDMVKTLRSGDDKVNVPMVFMTYANVVFSYGAERFISKCAEVGIDGLILPDIPYEEKGEFVEITRKYGLDLVSLIAPTSEGRISRIASEAEGFIYVVSSLGVTGVRSKITTDIGSVCEAIRNASSVPCAIGFGISTPAQAADMARYADGVIVGSAIVKLIAANGVNSAPVVGEYVKTMKDAIKEL